MDVKSTFLYGTVEEEVYVCQPPGFEDHDHPDKVYKVVNALYGLHQAPRACQDKYVAVILRKFGLLDTKSTSTPIDIEKPLLKDPDGCSKCNGLFENDVLCSKYLKCWFTHHTTNGSQFTMSNPHQELASPDQMVSGKDSSNSLMAENLLKIVCDSPLLGVNTPRCDEDRLELIELTIFLLPKVEKVGIGVSAVDLQVSAIRHLLLLFSLTNWCCSLSAVRSSS
nr:ribonuclease H-like domain, reverse transcriptase, RNA-dependent DNA polymerase [Tanacetum cinerariifolium]